MRGCHSWLRPTLVARLAETIEHAPGRLELVRVRLVKEDGAILAIPTGAQGSHIQSSLVDTDGLARFAAEETKLDAGADVTVEVWRLPEEA
jgi:molybdopterin biosynthesis enzyme